MAELESYLRGQQRRRQGRRRRSGEGCRGHREEWWDRAGSMAAEWRSLGGGGSSVAGVEGEDGEGPPEWGQVGDVGQQLAERVEMVAAKAAHRPLAARLRTHLPPPEP